jgi:Mrp family chromosome partitioning ATPase
MSVGFLLESPDDAVVWRGPRKYALIREFLQRVEWGELDFLVIDAPPGTGDEPMAVAELARPGAAAVLVTTPQDLAVADVRRSVKFCHEVSLPVIGIIENMSGLTCPACGHRIDLFKRGGGERLAKAVGSTFLGRIPIDPGIVACGDAGDVGVSSDLEDETVKAFADVVKPILEIDGKGAGSCEEAAAADRPGEAGRRPTSAR